MSEAASPTSAPPPERRGLLWAAALIIATSTAHVAWWWWSYSPGSQSDEALCIVPVLRGYEAFAAGDIQLLEVLTRWSGPRPMGVLSVVAFPILAASGGNMRVAAAVTMILIWVATQISLLALARRMLGD